MYAINVYSKHGKQNKVSRFQIIKWVNNFLKCKITKVEELCTGTAYCQLMDVMFPGCVKLNRVKLKPNQEYEYIMNFKILQSAFTKVHIEKQIPIELLIKGRFQDNFDFSKWFKELFDANYKKHDCISANVSCSNVNRIAADTSTQTNSEVKAIRCNRHETDNDKMCDGENNLTFENAKNIDVDAINIHATVKAYLEESVLFWRKLHKIEELCSEKPVVADVDIKEILYDAKDSSSPI